MVWGSRVVTIGGDAPVRVQSMTNTDTVDAIGTAIQVKELAVAGSEIVRITVNTPEAAEGRALYPRAARPHGHRRALVGDFHYNGHRSADRLPGLAQALSKVPHQPRQRRQRARRRTASLRR